jgi:hypothetical protein
VNRRKFITLLGGAVAWPLTARGQQPLVGFMSSRAPLGLDVPPMLLARADEVIE